MQQLDLLVAQPMPRHENHYALARMLLHKAHGGVALVQAILIGLMMVIAHVPLAGVAAAVVLVLGIAQVPAVIVTIPAIAYIWIGGNYGTVQAVAYTVGLVLAGMADNVLKPLLLGRGVDAPMPVILLGLALSWWGRKPYDRARLAADPTLAIDREWLTPRTLATARS